MKLLMSIHPEFVDKIIREEKKYEFRKRIFRKDVDEVIVYTTSPVRCIECTFEVGDVIEDTPHHLWEQFHKYGGISRKDFFKYFDNVEKGYAIKIMNVNKLKKPIDMTKYDNFVAPQSFRYLSEDELNYIKTN